MAAVRMYARILRPLTLTLRPIASCGKLPLALSEIMINEARAIVLNATKYTVVFLHLIGSHGPQYYERSSLEL